MSAIPWVEMAKEAGRRESRARKLLKRAEDARRKGCRTIAAELVCAAMARRVEAEQLHALAVAGRRASR